MPIFLKGECVYQSPSLKEIRESCRKQVNDLWDETKRFEYPEPFIVDLSRGLWDLKQRLIQEHTDVE